MLGRGVYGISEVARYTGLHSQRVLSWFTTKPYGVKKGPLFDSDYPIIENNYGVSFLDLIDVLVAGQLRESGVSMAKLRAVYNKLKHDLNTAHPFCHHKFYTDGKEVIIRAADALGDEVMSEVESCHPQQLYLEAETFLRRVDYSDETQLAARWHIAERVVIDPDLAFGKPVINGAGTTTFVLARSYAANDRNATLVAELFNLTPADVVSAFDFEERYGRLKAA